MQHEDVGTLIDYLFWVRDRVLAAAAALPEGEFRSGETVATRDLRATLVHQLENEWAWRVRLGQGAFPTGGLNSADYPTLDDLVNHWHREERELRTWFERVSDAELAACPPGTTTPSRCGSTSCTSSLTVSSSSPRPRCSSLASATRRGKSDSSSSARTAASRRARLHPLHGARDVGEAAEAVHDARHRRRPGTLLAPGAGVSTVRAHDQERQQHNRHNRRNSNRRNVSRRAAGEGGGNRRGQGHDQPAEETPPDVEGLHLRKVRPPRNGVHLLFASHSVSKPWWPISRFCRIVRDVKRIPIAAVVGERRPCSAMQATVAPLPTSGDAWVANTGQRKM